MAAACYSHVWQHSLIPEEELVSPEEILSSQPVGETLACDVAQRDVETTDTAPAIPGMWNVVVCVVVYLCLCNPVYRIPTGDFIRHIFCSIRPLLSHGRKRGSRRPPSRCLRSSGESNDGRQTGLRCRGQGSRRYGHGPRHPRWVKHGRLGICCLSLPL